MRAVRRSTTVPDEATTAAARAAAEAVGLDFAAYTPVAPVRARKAGPAQVTWTSSDPRGRAIVATISSAGIIATVTPGIGGGRAPREDVRENILKVRANDAEQALMEAAAKRAGLALTTWLREAGLREAAR